MRLLASIAICVSTVSMVGCGGGDHAPFTAKAWDTPFVTVTPAREVTDTGTASFRRGRTNLSLATYGQIPVSIGPEVAAASESGLESGLEAGDAFDSQGAVNAPASLPPPSPTASASAPVMASVTAPTATASASHLPDTVVARPLGPVDPIDVDFRDDFAKAMHVELSGRSSPVEIGTRL